jgi:hypothetical protein
MGDKLKNEKDVEHITLSNGRRMTKKTWLMASLRRSAYRWPPRSECEKKSRVSRGLYKCAMCEGEFKAKQYAIDHINPVIPYTGFPTHPITGQDDWTIIIDRLFCPLENFQILCLDCHSLKTQTEDSMRAAYSAKRKEEAKELKKKIKLDKKNKV